jgi:hypothetical protein
MMTENVAVNPNQAAHIRIEDKRRFQDFRVETALLKTDLSIYERMVYVVLCSFASREGECFPSIGTIAKSAGCSERQVQRSLQKLEEIKVIRKSPAYRPGTSRQLANLYSLVGFRTKVEEGVGCLAVTPVFPGGVTGGHRGGDCQSPQVLPEELKEQEKIPNTLYSEAGASAGEKGADDSGPSDAPAPCPQGIPYQEKPEVKREEIPAAFRETFDLFLLKTGRQGITREELARLEALEKIHVPSRVQETITKALERFKNPRKPGSHQREPSELTWHYIWDVLKNQRSSGAGKAAGRKAERRLDPKWVKQAEAWAKSG